MTLQMRDWEREDWRGSSTREIAVKMTKLMIILIIWDPLKSKEVGVWNPKKTLLKMLKRSEDANFSTFSLISTPKILLYLTPMMKNQVQLKIFSKSSILLTPQCPRSQLKYRTSASSLGSWGLATVILRCKWMWEMNNLGN